MKVWLFLIWALTQNWTNGLPIDSKLDGSGADSNVTNVRTHKTELKEEFGEDIDELAQIVTERLGRFMFQAGVGSSNNLDLLSSVSGMNPLNIKLNKNAILKGIFEPDNIFIHVGQNFVDVIGSSIVWTLLAMFTSQTSFAEASSTTSSSHSSKATVKSSGTDVSKLSNLLKDFTIPGSDFQSTYKIQSSSNQLPSYVQPPDIDMAKLRDKLRQQQLLASKQHQLNSLNIGTIPRSTLFVPSSPFDEDFSDDMLVEQSLPGGQSSPEEIDRTIRVKPTQIVKRKEMKDNDPESKIILEDKQIEGAPMTQGKKIKLKKVTNKKLQSVNPTSSSQKVTS